MGTGIVGSRERSDNELSGLDRGDRTADLLDDAGIFTHSKDACATLDLGRGLRRRRSYFRRWRFLFLGAGDSFDDVKGHRYQKDRKR